MKDCDNSDQNAAIVRELTNPGSGAQVTTPDDSQRSYSVDTQVDSRHSAIMQSTHEEHATETRSYDSNLQTLDTQIENTPANGAGVLNSVDRQGSSDNNTRALSAQTDVNSVASSTALNSHDDKRQSDVNDDETLRQI